MSRRMNTPPTRRTALHRWVAQQHLMIGVRCYYWGFRFRLLMRDQPAGVAAVAFGLAWVLAWVLLGPLLLAGHYRP